MSNIDPLVFWRTPKSIALLDRAKDIRAEQIAEYFSSKNKISTDDSTKSA